MTVSRALRPARHAVGLVGAIYVAVGILSGPGSAQDAAAPPPPTVTVSTPLALEIVEWQEFTGQFRAVDVVEIRARVAGYLTMVHFQDGDVVAKDQLLYTIDRRPFEIALDIARAQVAQAVAAFDLSKTQLARTENLQRENVAARATLDERAAQADQAAGALQAAQASLAEAELNLSFTEIRSPIAGRISANAVTEGNLVTEGTSLMSNVVSETPIYFEFDMSEANYLAYVRAYRDGRMPSRRDDRVEVQARLFDEETFDRMGQLYFVDNQVDRSTGTIRVRARFDNADGLLTPGQFGILRMPASEPYTAILIPDQAVVSDQATKLVLTIGPDDTVVPKIVRPGPRELGLRIIRSGLDASDRIIIEGMARARPGAKVAPVAGEIVAGDGRR